MFALAHCLKARFAPEVHRMKKVCRKWTGKNGEES
jgi:hypothetical protein